MKFVNVTNSHSRLVLNQLENTDAQMVKVFTAGNTTIIFTVAPEHNEILLVNKKRAIRPLEIEEAKNFFLEKMKPGSFNREEITIIEFEGLAEVSIPKHDANSGLAV